MKLVLIEWLDSHGSDTWEPFDKIKRDGETVKCRSVGWVLSSNRQYTLIVPHVSSIDDESATPFGSGHISIPKRAITSLRVLEP